MNKQEPTNLLVKEMRKQSVLLFIRNEITKITDKNKRSGWSTWALFGSLAASSSYLITQLKQPQMTWEAVSIISIFLYLSYTVVLTLKNLINGGNKSKEDGNRFELLNNVHGSSRALILAILILEISVWRFIPELGIKSIIIKIYINIYIAISVICFINSYLRIPIPKKNPKQKLWIVVIVLIIIIGILTVIFLFQKIQLISSPFNVYDWETGITITTISLLILMLLKNNETPLLLPDLEDIERQLSLSEISSTEAQSQLDIVLYGITLGSYFEPEVQRNISSLRKLEKTAQQVNEKLIALEKISEDISGKILPKNILTIMLSLKDSIENHVNSAKTLRVKINKQKQHLLTKLDIAQKLFPGSTEELKKLINRIDDIENSITSQSNKSTERCRIIENHLKKTLEQNKAKVLTKK